MDPTTQEVSCSFCGKKRGQVKRMISGPSHKESLIFICNECVKLCNEIIAEENPDASKPEALPQVVSRHTEVDTVNLGDFLREHFGARTPTSILMNDFLNAYAKAVREKRERAAQEKLRRAAEEEQRRTEEAQKQAQAEALRVHPSSPELIRFTQRLGMMVEKDRPLQTCFDVLSADENLNKLMSVAQGLMAEVAEGKTLHEAMSEHPDVFDSLYLAVIKANAGSVTFAPALKKLGAFLQKDRELHQLWGATGTTSETMRSWYLTHTLGMLLSQGVPIPEALPIVARGLTIDTPWHDQLLKVHATVSAGKKTLGEALEKNHFPRFMVLVVRGAEAKDNLNTTLVELARAYEGEARLQRERG